jgi:uncharacterized membrane protein
MSKYKYKLKPQKWIPIGIIIFFILICCLVTNIISPNDKTMNIFLTSFGLGISAAVVYCSIIQNVIQKDNIKIQLFDKRYRVYQAVLDTITLIKRDNWDRYILYKGNDVNQQFILAEEELYKVVFLSYCLFDKNIISKLVKINDAFVKISAAYKQMCTLNFQSITAADRKNEFSLLFIDFVLSKKDSKEFNNEFKNKFPKEYSIVMNFQQECNKYLSLIDECNILKELGEYIKIDKLDQ